jgi:hypothetical protein
MKEMKEKRWVRGTRPDMVRENGKIYYRICKCGLTKESYKMPMCKGCDKEYHRNRKENQHNFNVYIKDLVVKGKRDNSILDKVPGKTYYPKLLVEFVDKIERRNGIASLEDIFCDLITLFNYYGCNQDIDTLPTGMQLSVMWNFIKEYKNKMEKSKKS